MAACASAFMMLSYFPYLTYAIPAVSGLFVMLLVIELGEKWALAGFISSAVIIFLLAENEAKFLYIFLFGYYPIVKAVIERLNKRMPEWLLKMLVFNAAAVLVYGVFSRLYGISLQEFGRIGRYGAWIFLAAGNGVFVLYDITVSRMAAAYMARLHGRIFK